MITVQKKGIKPGLKAGKKNKAKRTFKSVKNKSQGFEKAWEFWKTAQIDLSTFKFDREEANAR
jgi:hypothetical protein